MEPRHRPIRSFVRRAGRITDAQKRALGDLWPVYGIDAPDGCLDLPALFGRDEPITLEIGFGDGNVLAQLAASHIERDFVGIEVHEPGVGALLLAVERGGMRNIRVIRDDAMIVLSDWLAPCSIARINLYFPDPWPKKRHHKRRIVQPDFLAYCARALEPGGLLHMATDWEPYAEHMLEVANACPWFDNADSGESYSPRPADRPESKFERRGRKLGHGVWDLLYRRNSAPVSR